MTSGDPTLGGERTVRCADGVLQNRTLETDRILLTDVAPIRFLKKKKKKNRNSIRHRPGAWQIDVPGETSSRAYWKIRLKYAKRMSTIRSQDLNYFEHQQSDSEPGR